MLVRPVTSNQLIKALQVEDLKIVKRLKRHCSAKNIYMKTIGVLNDASIKTNAKEFKNKVSANIGVPGVADKVGKATQKQTGYTDKTKGAFNFCEPL